MQPRAFLIIALTAAMLFPGTALRAANPSPDEQQIRKIEQDWGDSYVKRDPAVSQKILADDFISIGPDGIAVDKADYIKAVTGLTIFSDVKINYMAVRFYNSTAVVVGRVSIVAKSVSQDESGEFAFTDTFVKQNGEWKVVSSQATPVTKH
jgi:hypothetical protein